jgi:hypothetical protein
MTAKLMLGNLPADITEEEIRSRFCCIGVGEGVSLLHTGNPDRLSALVDVDAERHTLQLIVDHNSDIWWKNRHISVYVPLHG